MAGPKRRRIAGEQAPGAAAPVGPTPARPVVPQGASKAAARPVPTPAVPQPRGVDTSGLKAGPALPLLVGALVLALGATVLFFGIQRAREEAPGTVPADSAEHAVETIFSWNYQELDRDHAAAVKVMSPTFAKEYEKIIGAADEAGRARQAVAIAAARGAALMPCGNHCSADRASVLVFYDQARLVSGNSDPQTFSQRVTVDLVKIDGKWLVDNIKALDNTL